MRLHYLVKLQIRVFCENSKAGNSRNFTYWLWFHLPKKMQLWLWRHTMTNLIRKICTKPYQNRPRFVKDMTKSIWCVFWFTVLTVVHL